MWSVKVTSAQKDDVNNNGNLLVTFTASNIDGRTVNRIVPGIGWTPTHATFIAENMIRELNNVDAANANASIELPNVQAFIAQNIILASG